MTSGRTKTGHQNPLINVFYDFLGENYVEASQNLGELPIMQGQTFSTRAMISSLIGVYFQLKDLDRPEETLHIYSMSSFKNNERKK